VLALPLFALLLPVVAVASSACADPAIVAARVSPVTGSNGALNVYNVAITVRNRGNQGQQSSLLQSVAIYQDGTKVGQEGVAPLRPGAAQTVNYRFERAVGARAGSTELHFTLLLRDPHGVPISACSSAGHAYRLSV